MSKRLTTEGFIEKARLVHGDRYDYSKVIYVNNITTVIIICEYHGEFYKTPSNHVSHSQGCVQCTSEFLSKSQACTVDRFIEKAIEVHKGCYDYCKVVYTNSYTKISILCSKHGEFIQTPASHLTGRGCPACKYEKVTFSGKYYRQTPGIIYYMYFPTISMWKVGVTINSIKERFRKEPLPYIVLDSIHFPIVKQAYDYETKIFRKFNSIKYKGPKLLIDGNTELLTKDILEYIADRTYEEDFHAW